MIEIKDIVHITLPVTDLDRSEKFYCGLLGMQIVQRVPPAGMVWLKAGDAMVILCRSKTPIDPNPGDEILIHFAFRVGVDKYEEATAQLRAQGVRILHEEDRNEGVFHGRQAYFHDPDRNVLELIGLKKIEIGPGIAQGSISLPKTPVSQ